MQESERIPQHLNKAHDLIVEPLLIRKDFKKCPEFHFPKFISNLEEQIFGENIFKSPTLIPRAPLTTLGSKYRKLEIKDLIWIDTYAHQWEW